MSLTEDLLEEAGALVPACAVCGREISDRQVREHGGWCSTCRAARRKGALGARTDTLNRPMRKAVVMAGSVFPGAAVRVSTDPPLIGTAERQGREGGWWVRTAYGTDWFAAGDVRVVSVEGDRP
jgi:hypothetical protein